MFKPLGSAAVVIGVDALAVALVVALVVVLVRIGDVGADEVGILDDAEFVAVAVEFDMLLLELLGDNDGVYTYTSLSPVDRCNANQRFLFLAELAVNQPQRRDVAADRAVS
jgi:purine-cytosine permease-like protein